MTAQEKKTEANKIKMLENLEKSMNIVSTAAKATGIDRSTHYDWINPKSDRYDETYAKAVELLENVAHRGVHTLNHGGEGLGFR